MAHHMLNGHKIYDTIIKTSNLDTYPRINIWCTTIKWWNDETENDFW